jgi:hypothetical protein
MINRSTQFSIKFGGKPNEVNAATYGVVLVNTVTLFEEANKELNTGVSIDIKVKSENEGSFLAALGIEISALDSLLTPDNFKLIGTVATALMGVVGSGLALRKRLKGEPPKEIKSEGDNIQLSSSDGNQVTINKHVYNFFDNPKTQKAMKSIFGTLDDDTAVQDFSLLDKKNQPLFKADRNEFPILKTTILLPTAEKNYISDTAVIHIIKLGFDKNLVWDFIYRGEKKSAYIKDESFWDKVARREVLFGNGDELKVKLDIEQAYDETYGTYLNTGNIVITDVLEILPKPVPPRLFNDNDDSEPIHRDIELN